MTNSPKKKNKPSSTPPKSKSLLARLLSKSFLILNLFSVLPLLIANLAWFIPPNDFWLSSILSIMTPWLLIPPLFWMVFWSFYFFPYAILNLAVLLLNFNFFFNTFQFHFQSKPSSKALSVVSFNAAAFHYKPKEIQEVAVEIKKFQPDILCIQEFINYGNNEYQTAVELFKDQLNMEHAAWIELLPKSQFGIVVFSKYPIKKFAQICDTPTKNGMMFADIECFGKTIRVYNLHLQSYNLGDSGKTQIESIAHAWQIAKRIRETWDEHDKQIQRFELSLKDNKKPLIVCADLNNPPYNTFYKRIRRDMQDSFLAAGWGLGHTHGYGLFSFRIDYVFASNHFNIERHSIFHNKYSDHYLIHSFLAFDE